MSSTIPVPPIYGSILRNVQSVRQKVICLILHCRLRISEVRLRIRLHMVMDLPVRDTQPVISFQLVGQGFVKPLILPRVSRVICCQIPWTESSAWDFRHSSPLEVMSFSLQCSNSQELKRSCKIYGATASSNKTCLASNSSKNPTPTPATPAGSGPLEATTTPSSVAPSPPPH